MRYLFNFFNFGLGGIKLVFISMILIFSGFIITGLYFGLNETAKVTEVALKNEEITSTVKTTTSTIKTTVREISNEETTLTIETTSTTPVGDLECEALGCPTGTNFVGSSSSDKYHYCSCSYAKRIKPENLICFSSKEEAEEEGYTQSSCTTVSSTVNTTTSSIITSTSTTFSSTIMTIISTSVSTSSSTTTSTFPLANLFLNVIAEKNPIVRGNNQTIATEVTDGNNAIENAVVNVTVKYASGYVKECGIGFTNSTGIFVCSWKISGSATPGIFNVTSIAFKDGYTLGTGDTVFEVITAS